MITEARVEMTRGEIKFILEPYLNMGVINKSGQVVSDKTKLGMLGTIPNRVTGFHEYDLFS